jgi:hypothetical protein
VKSQALSTLVRDYLVPAVPGRLMLGVMDASANIDLRALDLVPLIEANQAYAHFLRSQRAFGKKMTDWTSEAPEGSNPGVFLTRRLVGLLGKKVIRNIVVSTRLSRMTNPKLPRKKGDSLEIEPKTIIPFALEAEELCQEQSWAYPEMAFVGGLHYDWLAGLLNRNKAPKDAQETLKAAFTEGIQIAKRGYRLSERLKNLKHGRYVFAAGLVAPLGQALMAAIFKKGESDPNWGSFTKELEAYGKRKSLAQLYLEKETFELTSHELTGLFVNSFQLLKEIEPAIRFARQPAMLAGANPDQHALAMVLSVAWAYTGFVPGKGSDDSPLFGMQKAWLTRNRVNESDLRAFK